MVELPSAAEQDYIKVFKLGAIYVVAPSSGRPVYFGACEVPKLAIEEERRRLHKRIVLHQVFWFKKIESAFLLVEFVKVKVVPEDSVEAVCGLIEATATEHKANFRKNDLVLAEVRNTMKQFDRALYEANANGKLSWFNDAYAKSNKTVPYWKAREKLRNLLAFRYAHHLKIDERELILEVFATRH